MSAIRIYCLSILLVLTNFLISASLYAAEQPDVDTTENAPVIVRYNVASGDIDSKQSYYIDVLKLALEKSRKEFGPFLLEPVFVETLQGRRIKLVADEQLIDVMWTMTSKPREQELRAIYVPLMKGLMGYRISLIRSGEQTRFGQIDNLAELKTLTLGQGQDWPDSDILESQGFTVMRGKSSTLIDMLSKGRFDAFPRALHEPWSEVEGRSDVEVESSLLIKYTAPIYFFVNKENEQLARRIESGLERAVEDGSFDKLFYSHPTTAEMLKRAKLKSRKIFEIDNPNLSPMSRKLLNNKSLWLYETLPGSR
ncbi:hypothetical protein [uncultured Shewanella sp.]|uniref:substrate-binding periplasmic protein n=1 Tax=uncultured Shewanella sp. TaxID=173975 RepID=UPI0026173527|nr:hypothetical protein [uncultured Shewanella sp.]